MIIGIIPKILETYKNQFEIAIESNLVRFVRKIFPRSEIKILYNKSNYKLNLLIISGGNTIQGYTKKKKDLLRFQLDNYHYEICRRNKVPILGLCHGAMFITKKNKGLLSLKKHVGTHIITIDKKQYSVNSYHNIIIKKIPKNFEIIATAEDNSIECFINKKLKILGMMWHPERYTKIKKLDLKLIKKIL
jgi:gamma-glutamyl-gamma-aminobutyrate hydrolase PuuD